MSVGDPYLYVGLRGLLTMAPWARSEYDRCTLAEDAFSLIVKRSELLGLADFGGDAHGTEQWGHADAGGDWTQDGAERLLGWLQADPRTGGSATEPPPENVPRLLPIQSSLAVVEQALDRVGSVQLSEVVAVVPLRLMADPLGSIAVGRDWLAFGSQDAARRRLTIEIDAGSSLNPALDPSAIVETFRTLGEDVLGDVGAQADGQGSAGADAFLGRSVSANAIVLEAQTPRWAVDLGAWIVELAAYASRYAGAKRDVLVTVRSDPG